ncbi:hypothetical protein K493DRAFT_388345 [Basidiobolus meristosporus CBS 931.73]|uniref:GSKIP domain-containing protein n=1 Tax=Basidiobolus meristosporus CBS 931.73 TaxID=1314790 RepID=A0A1Y1XB45_9FUNG|nr:hypothetical protein K493DRAFT_388345 [Basidiobolus meristosporus CBS 931.73]|eukprot:ORX82958.1 hypothetical protein K493DRAFT_388345 [Basidiobolus meristosporus CBS 931.73]
MKYGQAPEDLVDLLRRIRFGIQEETLEILFMKNTVDEVLPCCAFRLRVLEGIEITVEVSRQGYVISQLGMPIELQEEVLVQKHHQSISSIQGQVFPNIETLLMSVSQQYKSRLYSSIQFNSNHYNNSTFICR